MQKQLERICLSFTLIDIALTTDEILKAQKIAKIAQTRLFLKLFTYYA